MQHNECAGPSLLTRDAFKARDVRARWRRRGPGCGFARAVPSFPILQAGETRRLPSELGRELNLPAAFSARAAVVTSLSAPAVIARGQHAGAQL